MMREPVATTEMRQVRVAAKLLTKDALLLLSFDCVGSRKQVIPGFAQSLLINVDSHGVVGGL